MASLYDTMHAEGEWLQLFVYMGTAHVERYQELQQLINSGKVFISRYKGKKVIVLRTRKCQTDVNDMLERYDMETREVIVQAFHRFKLSRKSKSIADGRLTAVLTDWKYYSVEAVSRGVREYVKVPNYKRVSENYCTGIIRRIAHDIKRGEGPRAPRDTLPEYTIPEPEPIDIQIPEIKEIQQSAMVSKLFSKRGGTDIKDPIAAKQLLDQIHKEVYENDS